MDAETKLTEGAAALSSWFEDEGHSRHGLARRLGCDVRLVRRWSRGEAVPSIAYRERLAWLTEGAIRPEMWTRPAGSST